MTLRRASSAGRVLVERGATSAEAPTMPHEMKSSEVLQSEILVGGYWIAGPEMRPLSRPN